MCQTTPFPTLTRQRGIMFEAIKLEFSHKTEPPASNLMEIEITKPYWNLLLLNYFLLHRGDFKFLNTLW